MARFILSQKVVESALGRSETLLYQRSPLLGICRLDRQELGPDWGRQLLNHILPRGHQLGSLLYKLIRPVAGGLCGIARHSVNLAAKLHGEASCYQRAGVLRPFDHQNAETHTGKNPVAYGKVLRRRKRAHGKFSDDYPALRDFLENFPILLRIDNIDAATEYSHGCAGVGAERAPVRT